MIAPFPENTRAPLCKEAGEIMGFINRNNVKKLQEIPNQLSESYKQSIYRGVGRFAAERYGFNQKNCDAFINALPLKYKTCYYEGIGKQITFRFGGDPETVNAIINKLPAKLRPFIGKGVSEEISKSNINGSMAHI